MCEIEEIALLIYKEARLNCRCVMAIQPDFCYIVFADFILRKRPISCLQEDQRFGSCHFPSRCIQRQSSQTSCQARG